MLKTRPVNLNLFTINFPISAIVSIIHRVTGVLIFLLIPLLLWIFQVSIHSRMSFETVQSILANHSLSKFLVWLGLSFLTYHCIAGFRHLLMDYSGFGEEKDSGSQIAYAFLLFSLITSFSIGYWLW